MQLTKEQRIEAKDYPIIARLYVKENPEGALRLLQGYKQAQSSALDTNLHNLNYYFLSFCNLFSLLPLEYLGQLYTRDKVEKRRLFVGAMIRVYKPQLITHDIAQNGLAESLCIILQYENGNMSKLIDEVLVLMGNNLYGYADEVDQIVEKLMNNKSGYGFGPSLIDQMEGRA